MSKRNPKFTAVVVAYQDGKRVEVTITVTTACTSEEARIVAKNMVDGASHVKSVKMVLSKKA